MPSSAASAAKSAVLRLYLTHVFLVVITLCSFFLCRLLPMAELKTEGFCRRQEWPSLARGVGDLYSEVAAGQVAEVKAQLLLCIHLRGRCVTWKTVTPRTLR